MSDNGSVSTLKYMFAFASKWLHQYDARRSVRIVSEGAHYRRCF